jgi:hypothetical protein
MDKVLNTNDFPNIQIPPAPPNTKQKTRSEMIGFFVWESGTDVESTIHKNA